MSLPDPLARQRAFPDAKEIFTFTPISFETALAEGLIVLDTNVLLVPYGTGKASIEQIRTTYRRLADEGRLRVPGQVAREFAANRAEKLKTLYHQLSLKRNLSISRSEYPLLEGIEQYEAVRKAEDKLATALDEYRSLQRALLDVVSNWNWDDPVSAIYRDVFEDGVVFDPPIDQQEVLKDLKYRFENQLPPGYKDANNEHSGIGDFLIWRTLLLIGEVDSKHVIFVSGDEKSDWWYRSDNRALYPRFELVDEFRRKTNGKSLFIISFAELLQHLGAPATVVEEVREEESAVSASTATQEEGVLKRWMVGISAVRQWFQQKYPSGKLLSTNGRNFDFRIRLSARRAFDVDIRHFPKRSDIVNLESIAVEVAESHADGEIPVIVVVLLYEEMPHEQVLNRFATETEGTIVNSVIVGTLNAEDCFVEIDRFDRLYRGI